MYNWLLNTLLIIVGFITGSTIVFSFVPEDTSMNKKLIGLLVISAWAGFLVTVIK